MKVMRFILIVMLSLLVTGIWLAIIQQAVQIEYRRIPEERLIEILGQYQISEHRLAVVAAQNLSLTSRTQAILERMAPPAAPAAAFTPYHGPDEPLVIYEAEPMSPSRAKPAARKGKRK